MYSSTRRSRGSAALMAVLQSILLITALVLGPAAAIAQEHQRRNLPRRPDRRSRCSSIPIL